MNQHVSAIARLEQRLGETPGDVPTMVALAVEYIAAGQLDDAEDHLTVALAIDAGNQAARLELARCCRKAGRLDEASDTVRHLLQEASAHPAIQFERGLLALARRDMDDALTAFQEVTRLEPGRADAWVNLGVIQMNHCADLGGARASFEHALACVSDHIEAHINLATVTQHSEGPAHAVGILERLLERRPDHADAHWHLALALLSGRDYGRGWVEYEWRDRVYGAAHRREFPFVPWDGASLGGKRLLVFGEQGLGDEIMFASCIPDVIRMADHCIVECHERLATLFARSFPEANVHGSLRDGRREWLDKYPEVDRQAAMGTLPRYLRTASGCFPRHGGYLVPDPDRVAKWRQRLDALGGGPMIGISWRGGSADTRQRFRSIDPGRFARLLAGRPVRWVNLQHGERAGDIAVMRTQCGVEVLDDPCIGADIEETAALVSCLDLVVTVANTNVHLAGALGRPVHALISSAPEWRYGASGEGMDWYPSVRLFRQTRPDVWEDVCSAALRDII